MRPHSAKWTYGFTLKFIIPTILYFVLHVKITAYNPVSP